ncbi:MAG: hypothetical protein JO313_10860 [Verrucomicrobia bacterium]|nr:hypothetical protein [Verrucomicrobiota bacterium]
MPDLSATGSPIKVLRWLADVGELVDRGQPILEVETDKAIMEVEALGSGTLLEQLVSAGQEASTGQVLAIIGTEEASPQSSTRSKQSAPVEGLKKYNRDFLLNLYRRMLLIRQFEERVKSLFLEGIMPGTIHQCQGQEATAVGICAALNETDFITSTFRGHGHALAKGLTVQEMLDELFGAVTGCCKGKGGSMHIGNFEKGMIPGIAIVGWEYTGRTWNGSRIQNADDSTGRRLFLWGRRRSRRCVPRRSQYGRSLECAGTVCLRKQLVWCLYPY